jgi:hypothetical protein
LKVGLGRRIRAFFGTDEEAGIELVMAANGYASIALGAMGWLLLELPLGWMVALVPVLFLAFGACLLFRVTTWIPAVLGSVVIGATSALLIAGPAIGSPGWWLRGGLGAGGGLAVGVWTYWRVGRVVRHEPK